MALSSLIGTDAVGACLQKARAACQWEEGYRSLIARWRGLTEVT